MISEHERSNSKRKDVKSGKFSFKKTKNSALGAIWNIKIKNVSLDNWAHLMKKLTHNFVYSFAQLAKVERFEMKMREKICIKAWKFKMLLSAITAVNETKKIWKLLQFIVPRQLSNIKLNFTRILVFFFGNVVAFVRALLWKLKRARLNYCDHDHDEQMIKIIYVSCCEV